MPHQMNYFCSCQDCIKTRADKFSKLGTVTLTSLKTKVSKEGQSPQAYNFFEELLGSEKLQPKPQCTVHGDNCPGPFTGCGVVLPSKPLPTITKNLPEFSLGLLQAYSTKPTSDKAKGLQNLILGRLVNSPYPTKQAVLLQGYPEKENIFQTARGWLHITSNQPIFARPCPPKARHGYVDSVPVNNLQELQAVADKITALGDPIEILLMETLTAAWSAILTPGTISIGPDHDGATSGRAIMLPINVSTFKNIDRGLFNLGPNEDPYMELVAQKGQTGTNTYDMDIVFAVQLRGGARQSGCSDFVPNTTIVKSILKAEGDLVEWSNKVQNVSDGTVIDAYGQSPASHYCVWGVTNKIPFLTTRHPILGEKLQAVGGRPEPTKADYEALANTILTFMAERVETKNHNLVDAAFGVCHSLAFLTPTDEAQRRLIGFCINTMFVFTLAAGRGEMRYWKTNGPGRHKVARPVKLGMKVSHSSVSRSKLFDATGPMTFKNKVESLVGLEKGFRTKGWSGSFGGSNWANGMAAAEAMFLSAIDFCLDPCAANYTTMINNLNILANAVHNGGRLFDKFTSNLDRLAVYPETGICSTEIFNLLFNYTPSSKKLNPEKAAGFLTEVTARVHRSLSKKQIASGANDHSMRAQVIDNSGLEVLIKIQSRDELPLVNCAQFATHPTNRHYGYTYIVCANKSIFDGRKPTLPSFNNLQGDPTYWAFSVKDLLSIMNKEKK